MTPAARDRGGEAQRANAIEQRHGREVQRTAQRVRRRDAAGETSVEVLGSVPAKPARQVGHDGIRGGDAVGEGHRVDERFQCRSRGAHGAGQVNGTGPGFVGPGTRVERTNLARGCIGHQHSERGPLRQGLQSLSPEAFECGLQRQVQGCVNLRQVGQGCRELRRVAGQRDAGGRYGRGCRCGIEQVRPGADRKDPVANRACGRGVAVGAQVLGSARDRHEEGGLGRFQCLGRHAEPGERAGADALDVAAERCEGKPDVEHATSAVMRLELHGAGDFDELRANGARARLEQASGLHRKSGATGYGMARAEQLRGGAGQGDRIDTGMVPEAAILDGDQQVGEQRRGVVRAEAPDATRRGEECQRAVLAVEDLAAHGGEAGEVGWEAEVEQGAEGGEHEAGRGEEGYDGKQEPPPPGGGWGEGGPRSGRRTLPPAPSRKGRGRGVGYCHSAATMVIRPAAWRANTAGSIHVGHFRAWQLECPGRHRAYPDGQPEVGLLAVSATTAA